MMRIAFALLFSLCLVACSAEADTEAVSEFVLEDVRDVFDTEEHAATPASIQIGEDGRYYVLDAANYRVLVLSQEGEVLHSMGRQGEGPGEFTNPGNLSVSGDSVRVLDYRAARVQVFTSDGEFTRSYDAPGSNIGGWYARFWPDGRLALPTMGFRSDYLVRAIDHTGSQVDSIGAVVSEPVEIMNFGDISDAASSGRIPESIRHWVLPIPKADGSLWLLLQADAAVRHYDEQGQLMQEFDIDVPEVEQLREQFFERNEDLPANTFVPLLTAQAGHALNDQLWFLLAGSEEEPARILVYAEDGTLLHRLSVPETMGTTDFALSPDRRTLYLAVHGQARLVEVDLPGELVEQ